MKKAMVDVAYEIMKPKKKALAFIKLWDEVCQIAVPGFGDAAGAGRGPGGGTGFAGRGTGRGGAGAVAGGGPDRGGGRQRRLCGGGTGRRAGA